MLLRYDSLRKQVLDHDGWQCQNCGSSNDLHVHHLRPRSTLGHEAPENLIKLYVVVVTKGGIVVDESRVVPDALQANNLFLLSILIINSLHMLLASIQSAWEVFWLRFGHGLGRICPRPSIDKTYAQLLNRKKRVPPSLVPRRYERERACLVHSNAGAPA